MVVGPYLFSTEASAASPVGDYATRFCQMTGLIFTARLSGGDGSDTGDGQEVQDVIRRLGRMLERCRCKEK